MGQNTKIEWTDATWNPLRARDRKTGKAGHYCELVSSGCANCYASAFQPRFGLPMYTGPSHREERLADVELFLDEKVLKEPLGWKKPRMVFVCSMTDLFLDAYPDQWLDKVFAVMALTPRHTFQVLTKRPERMRDYFTALPPDGDPRMGAIEYAGYEMGIDRPVGWLPDDRPLPNVWCGTSVEDQQRADERIPLLLQTPAAVRFLSVEPLLGPVDLSGYWGLFPIGDESGGEQWGQDTQGYGGRGIDWAILGGESGPGARPCDLAWLRSLVAQCRAAGVPVFVKQLGSRPGVSAPPDGYMAQDQRPLLPLRLRDRKGGSMEDWPADLRIRELPEVKHA